MQFNKAQEREPEFAHKYAWTLKSVVFVPFFLSNANLEVMFHEYG